MDDGTGMGLPGGDQTMKKLRTRMILTLLAINTMSSLLAETLTWALLPVLFQGSGEDVGQLFKSVIQSTLTLIIFAVFVVIGINELVEPITNLSNATRRVASRDYSMTIPQSARKDEVGELARNFGIMLQELKSTEYMQRDFIANVSHEFKTPLAIISGYASMLGQSGISGEERAQCVRSIAEEVDRLNKMTSNLLLLSRLNNQGAQMARASFSLDEQLRQTVLCLEAKWREKQIDFIMDVTAVCIDGNEEMLSHVWTNLIDNAIKYSHQESTVHIRTNCLPGHVQVIISDEGIGMDSNTCEKAFDQFFQGDTSRKESGNGLGLALVKRIVDLHSGSIAVESVPAVGSRFTVTLKA